MTVLDQDAIDALKERRGLVSVADKKPGGSRATRHAMINKMPTVREARDDAKEALKDFAESRIFKEIEAGNTTMIIFFAKTQMKDRGYIERQDVSLTWQDSLPPNTNPNDVINQFRAIIQQAANAQNRNHSAS